MNNLPVLATVHGCVQYPPFKIQVPASACADDLVAASNSTYELAASAHYIVFWFDFVARPFGVSGFTEEEVLAALPEEVDNRIFKCEELIAPLRLELVNPANCFTEGTFYAPCAHDAVLKYAREIRYRLDLLARIATKTLAGSRTHELLPGIAMRGRWQEIVRTYRELMPTRFEGLPSVHSLLNRLTVETASTIRAYTRRIPTDCRARRFPAETTRCPHCVKRSCAFPQGVVGGVGL